MTGQLASDALEHTSLEALAGVKIILCLQKESWGGFIQTGACTLFCLEWSL